MASHKSTKVTDDAADQPTMSVVDTNPEGMGSPDTEPDTELGATLDESASAEARPSVSVGTLQPLVDGLNGLAAPSGAPPAAPPPRAGMAPTTTPTTTTLAEPCLEELSARYDAGAERRRHQHMGDHLIAAKQIGQLRAQLDQASIAKSALTEQFSS